MDTSQDNTIPKEYHLKQIIIYDNNTGKSEVEWADGSVTEIDNKDLSEYTVKTFFEISKFNLSLTNLNYIKYGCIYTRTSNSKNETSIQTQKNNCMKYLKKHNYQLQYIAVDEGVSGRNMGNIKRELGVFSGYLDSTNVLVLNSIDRLGRHSGKGMAFLEKMANKNIDVVFLNENILYNKDISSSDKLTVHNCLTQAEFLSNHTSEKIKKINQTKKNNGEYTGSIAPYGYQIEKKDKRCLITNKSEQKIICDILKEYKVLLSKSCKKKHIYQKISYKLKIQKTKKRKTEFTESSIKRIIEQKIKKMDSEVDDLSSELINFNL